MDSPTNPAAITVIIPCFNSGAILPATLTALRQQTAPLDSYNVIIVDDGSNDDSEQIVRQMGLPASFAYCRQANQGAAAARNHGASLAGTELLLFLDSDVIAYPGLVAEHIQAQRRYPRTLVVGRTVPPPPAGDDLFLELMGHELFSLDLGDKERPISFQHVLSRNVSIGRAPFFEIGQLDASFPRSGFEDIEFAYRATRLGYNLIYNPAAAGVHNHTGSLAEVGEHMYNYQILAALVLKKHPELYGQIAHLRDKGPIRWQQDNPRLILRKIIRQLQARPPLFWSMKAGVGMLERHWPHPSLLKFMYWQVLGAYLYRGFRAGIRRYNPNLGASP